MTLRKLVSSIAAGTTLVAGVVLGLTAIDHLIRFNTELVQDAKADTLVEGLEGPQLDRKEVLCLAVNTYHEARGESTGGRLATMNVVLNRVADGRWPDSICEVVKQSKTNAEGKIIRGKCAFSWYCDGKEDLPTTGPEFDKIYLEAEKFLSDRDRVDITDGAVYYHSVTVYPKWRFGLTKTARIDSHFFYR